MKEQEITLNSSTIKKMANKIIAKAKAKNLIKPLSETFKDTTQKNKGYNDFMDETDKVIEKETIN